MDLIKRSSVSEYDDLSICAASCLHDILNPLTGVALYIDYLCETPQMKDELAPLQTSLRTMRMYSKQLSLFLKGCNQKKKIVAHKEIGTVVMLLNAHLLQNKISCVISSVEPAVLHMNPLTFQRIILNIISNAIEAYDECADIFEKKKIAISIIQTETHVKITIRDFGKGMNKETLHHATMLRFTTKKHGTGIGLWNTKRMIESVGGSMRINSAVGKGTAITLLFPKIGKLSHKH